MGPLHRTGALVGRAVMYRDIRLGVAVDALLDGLVHRLVGLDVLCGDGAHRFLPFPACDVVETHISVDSALVFLERDVDFYRVGGRAFSKLQGLPVRLSGIEVGTLADVVVTPGGRRQARRRCHTERRPRARPRARARRREPRPAPGSLT